MIIARQPKKQCSRFLREWKQVQARVHKKEKNLKIQLQIINKQPMTRRRGIMLLVIRRYHQQSTDSTSGFHFDMNTLQRQLRFFENEKVARFFGNGKGGASPKISHNDER